MKKSYLTVSDFVKKYMEVASAGGNYEDMAKYNGLSITYIKQRAWSLKKKGVKLPPLERINIPASVKELNAIVDSFKYGRE